MPRLLDLFCGAGGASVGYDRAGFAVVGVDLHPQPHYPFEFRQADAMEYLDWLLSVNNRPGFDAIHASPPCQRYSTLRTVTTRSTKDLISPVRERLKATGLPWVIENVPGAPLQNPVRICGTSLGCIDDDAELRRHRLFEANWAIRGSRCTHLGHRRPLGVYGHLTIHDRPNRPLAGDGSHHGWKAGKARARGLMGIDWPITDAELVESIPPAYTTHIGWQLLEVL